MIHLTDDALTFNSRTMLRQSVENEMIADAITRAVVTINFFKFIPVVGG